MKFLFCLFLLLTGTLLYAEEATILVPPDVLQDYKIFLAKRDPLTIKNFRGDHSRRDSVELVLIQQALKLGGFNRPLHFVTVATSYKRIHQEINEGRELMSGTTNWFVDADSRYVYRSEATIDDGEFEAGIYTSPKNKRSLALDSFDDFKKLTAVSNKAWTADWMALSKLKLKYLENVTTWDSMVKMVNAQRADFLLAPFMETPDLSLVYNGIKLIPVPNVKIALEGSRIFIVSKKHPNGAQAIKALNIGLKKLKALGVIKKAYEESGFLNAQVKTWKVINK